MAETQLHDYTGADASTALHEDTLTFLLQALHEGDESRARNLIKDLHQGDIAEIFHSIHPDERRLLLNAIRETLDPAVLVWLEGEVREQVLSDLGAEETAAAITKLDHDDAVQVIEDLGEKEKTTILESVPDDFRMELERGLALPEDAAGRIMDTCFIALPEGWDVGHAIDFLRDENSEHEDELPEDFYSIYLVDADKKPVGNVLVSRVMRHRRDVLLKDIMEEKLYVVSTTMDQEEVVHLFRKYALVSLPVVDNKGQMVGVISLDDVLDVFQEEADEDILHLSGLGGETDIHANYLQTAKQRLPWLMINLLTAVAASSVVANFQGAIAELVTLAVLMPIVASMAGNAGMQTLTVAVRGLALKELTTANARRVVRKEVMTGLVNGIALGMLVTLVVWGIYRNEELAAVFGTAVFSVLAIANFSGVVIPLLLTRLKIDPAVSSAVFLTTVTDISAFFIFLGLASWCLL